MRRLEWRQQKKIRSKIISYIFLLIIIVIFLATVGFKFMINTALFIAKSSQKDKANQAKTTNINDINLPPEIFDLPEATNSAKIKVNIQAVSSDKVLLYVNDQLQKEIEPNEDIFEQEIELQKGENSIYLISENQKNKQKKDSKTYKIIYKDEKPLLEITSPKDKENINRDEIQITGRTDKEVFVRINDFPVIVDSDGNFVSSLKLKEGDNKIKIEAKDIAGNTEVKELTVIYQKED